MPAADDHGFDDVIEANARYAAGFGLSGLQPRAARGLAIVTCMDSRIEPLSMLGLAPGDAKILRNAGARVTDDVVRSLVLARHLLAVERVMVVAHTQCRMAGGTEDDVHESIRAAGGGDTRELTFLVATDQMQTLRDDVLRARSSPHLSGAVVGGFLYDVETGRVGRVC
ncbi:MAG: carbonic anhydrase [Frankiaceae bacterium]|nr:carbonic anhydrase [Frankiaceae bacterium]